MFVRVIEGRVRDAASLRRQAERWEADVKQGTGGFLGSTAGVTVDGTGVVVARFRSEQAAQEDVTKPGLAARWSETENVFERPLSVRSSTDVETFFDYGPACEHAGFVQIVQGRALDRSRMQAIEDGLLDALRAARPSILGMLRVWFGDDFLTAVYFTNEADARIEEASGPPDAIAGAFAELESLMGDVRYYDLVEPWLS